MSVLLVTGTDTGVGKTIVTAAVAAAASSRGLRVAVVKPAQTGVGTGEESDVDTVRRLAAPDTAVTLTEYPDPLAPLAAARVRSLPPPELSTVVSVVSDLAAGHDVVLVEGAGGLLVPLGERWNAGDLALALRATAVVVVRAGLGTLNHTALTLEALARRSIPASVVIGAWPSVPSLVHRANLDDLPGELAGVLPSEAGLLPEFRTAAPGWLAPSLYGRFDAAAFRSEHRVGVEV
jgi:dethiobiotin synthetase